MTDPLLLTDDEVVALGVARSLAWPGGMPTVTADADEVAAAAFRGGRSLFVRGLLEDEGGEAGSLEQLANDVASAPNRIAVYLGDKNYARATWAVASSHYATAADWVLETVSPMGIHRLSRHPVDEHRSSLLSMLEAVISSGPAAAANEVPGSPEWLCMIAIGSDTATLAVAQHGSLLVGLVEVDDGAVRIPAELAVAEPSQVVDQLFGAPLVEEKPVALSN